jgi:hypothetical protein
MFVRRLVRRVQDELALGARRFLERAKHRVEAAGEAAQLVAALRFDPLGQIACLGHTLGRLGQAPHRGKRGSGHHEPEPRCSRDSPEADDDEERADLLERIVDLGQRPRELERELEVGDGDVAHVDAVDGCVV